MHGLVMSRDTEESTTYGKFRQRELIQVSLTDPVVIC